MPTYEYACTSCGHRFETVQSFSDAALTACPVCQGPLRKVFGNVGIVLKGSGFYKTDSRSSTRASSKDSSSKKETESTTASGDAAKDTKSSKDTKPAKESSPSSGSSTSASTPAAASSNT